MAKTYSIDFTIPENASDLAHYIGISAKFFEEIVSSDDRKKFYDCHKIPKAGRHRIGEFRDVWETLDERLVEAHKALARRFELFARVSDSRFPHDAAYGYVRHRGTRDNARVHCGAPLLLCADIRNFFPSISLGRLNKRFLELGMKPAAAAALAKFATIDDRLALGLNASPMLANLVCVDLDIKLHNLSQKQGCKYTRYADDIAISGRHSVPTREEIQKIVEDEGFHLNDRKFRQTKRGQTHYVTGLSISDKNGPHIPRRMKRRLRQELYYIKKFGIAEHLDRTNDISFQSGINRLSGSVLYATHIEQNIASRLKSQWEEIQKKYGISASYEPISTRQLRYVSCLIDETEITFGNKKFLALGLAFTENPNALITSTVATLRQHQVEDAFYAGDKKALAKKGLHFVDSHPDLRTAYIKVLSGLPFRGFVIFAEMQNADVYRETYISLLAKILPRRLMWYDSSIVTFTFEENSKIKPTDLEDVVKTAYSGLAKTNNRRPMELPNVLIGKKSDYPHFAVPDYLLAVFARFSQINDKPEEKNIRTVQFERLRDRYRAIVNGDTDEEFSRKRPFKPWPLVAD